MSRVRRTSVVLVALAVGVAAACGVSPESDPQAINPDNVPFSLLDPELTTTTTEAPRGDNEPFTFFLLRNTEDGGTFLEPVTRLLSLQPTATEVVTTLLDLQPDADEPAEAELVTRIPDDTVLIAEPSLNQSQEVLTLDFNENLLSVETPLHFAQITCTVTELDGVSRVRFLVEGDEIEVPIGSSALEDEPVDCAAYSNFQPTSTTTTAPG